MIQPPYEPESDAFPRGPDCAEVREIRDIMDIPDALKAIWSADYPDEDPEHPVFQITPGDEARARDVMPVGQRFS